MPDIDRTADIKVTAAQATMTAEIPLAGHASEQWRELFGSLVSQARHQLHAEAEDREDRTWVIVWLPSARPDFNPEPMLDAARALISQVSGNGAAVSVSRRSNRGCCPRVVGAAATVAASPRLVLTRLLEGRFAQLVSLPVRR
jgi:hypothetical protein